MEYIYLTRAAWESSSCFCLNSFQFTYISFKTNGIYLHSYFYNNSLLVYQTRIIMIISVIRIYNCSTYCISHVYADGEYICDGLEDTDRMLDQSQPLEYIKAHKVYGQTAIPTGYYKLTLDVVSPKYSKSKFYMDLCKGKVPRVLDVPAYDGVLLHCGNQPSETYGCLLVGYNKVKGKVVDSRIAFEKLYKLLLKHKNEEIYIKYTRLYKK